MVFSQENLGQVCVLGVNLQMTSDDLGDPEEDSEGISSTSERDRGPAPRWKGGLPWGRSPGSRLSGGQLLKIFSDTRGRSWHHSLGGLLSPTPSLLVLG